ncbi:hypothetical protein [Pantanalinema sp. GBBB05]|uniref:hypothetical protein n=1 Tax=Pantanalinema sp. GBBB05 TaxID=2604139 RepID=UPI001D3E858C|nr:hypothetical protein [Pantanalinema sp. GBBB05]
MEDFACLYLALIAESEQSQPTNQPSQSPRLLPKQHYQPSEPLTVIDDDREPSPALYPTLYF